MVISSLYTGSVMTKLLVILCSFFFVVVLGQCLCVTCINGLCTCTQLVHLIELLCYSPKSQGLGHLCTQVVEWLCVV